MKRALALSALFFLLSVPAVRAGDAIAPYVELTDAPTIAVDWSKGSSQAVTLHGNRSMNFVNGEKGRHYTLIVTQDATGSRNIIWPASVRWPGGSPPPGNSLLTTTANKTDYITFVYNGASYDAIGLAQNY